MPISVGIVGYEVEQHERVAALVAAVGGPVKAAALIRKTRTHIDNMRKRDARLSLEDLLPLCVEAGVSLDWVATGHQQRPDLGTGADGLYRVTMLKTGALASFAFEPAFFAALGLEVGHVSAAIVDDDGMEPLIAKGATVLVDNRPATPRSGIYLVTLDDEIVARRLHRLPDGRTELVADAFRAWRYALTDKPTVLHRVVWTGRLL